MLSSENVIFHLLYKRVEKKYSLRLLLKCFWALRLRLSTKQRVEAMSMSMAPFPLTRINADLDQIRKRFLTMRKLGISHVIGSMARKFQYQMTLDSKEAFSFKKFLTNLVSNNSLRTSTEQRLLSEAFQLRGTQKFVDLRGPHPTDPIVPLLMSQVDGKAFSDPRYDPETNRTFELPAGFKMSKIRFVLQGATTVGCSLLGWQVIWSADGGVMDIEGSKRGDWNAAGISTHEIKFPKEDFVIGVEYAYDGSTITGMLNTRYTL